VGLLFKRLTKLPAHYITAYPVVPALIFRTQVLPLSYQEILVTSLLTTQSGKCPGQEVYCHSNLSAISYNSSISGLSGNITVNGRPSYSCGSDSSSVLITGAGASWTSSRSSNALSKRGIGAGNDPGVDLNDPPYSIHNGTSIGRC
jgi:hypothetical protein